MCSVNSNLFTVGMYKGEILRADWLHLAAVSFEQLDVHVSEIFSIFIIICDQIIGFSCFETDC